MPLPRRRQPCASLPASPRSPHRVPQRIPRLRCRLPGDAVRWLPTAALDPLIAVRCRGAPGRSARPRRRRYADCARDASRSPSGSARGHIRLRREPIRPAAARATAGLRPDRRGDRAKPRPAVRVPAAGPPRARVRPRRAAQRCRAGSGHARPPDCVRAARASTTVPRPARPPDPRPHGCGRPQLVSPASRRPRSSRELATLSSTPIVRRSIAGIRTAASAVPAPAGHRHRRTAARDPPDREPAARRTPLRSISPRTQTSAGPLSAASDRDPRLPHRRHAAGSSSRAPAPRARPDRPGRAHRVPRAASRAIPPPRMAAGPAVPAAPQRLRATALPAMNRAASSCAVGQTWRPAAICARSCRRRRMRAWRRFCVSRQPPDSRWVITAPSLPQGMAQGASLPVDRIQPAAGGRPAGHSVAR